MSDAFTALRRRYLGSPEVDDAYFAGRLDVEGVGVLAHLHRAPGPFSGALQATARVLVGPLVVEFETMNPLCLLDLASADGLRGGDSVRFQGRIRLLDPVLGRLKLARLLLEADRASEAFLNLRARHHGGTHLVIGGQLLPVPNIPADYYQLLPLEQGGFALEPRIR